MNRPKLCSNATWNALAETFSTRPTNGRSPRGLFINTNNSIYIADRTNHTIKVWLTQQSNPVSIISGDLYSPYTLFVTKNGDIYIENGARKRIDKWILDSNSMVPVINVTNHCLCLFVDMNNNLYYIVEYDHQVMKISLNNTATSPEVVAGSISAGLSANELSHPHGIFVDTNSDLYVADSSNNRIQLFPSGQSNGTTLFGDPLLNHPTGVVLDWNGFLYIVDNKNHRIVRYAEKIFQCLVGCSGEGTHADQLSLPRTMAFDSGGNIFVTDLFNDRIQNFSLQANVCGM